MTYLLVRGGGYRIWVPAVNVEGLTDVSDLGAGEAATPLILDFRVLAGTDPVPVLPMQMSRPAVIWRGSGGQRRFAVLVDAIVSVLEIDDARFEPLPRLPRATELLFDRVLRAGKDEPLQFRLQTNLEACAARGLLRVKAARVARRALMKTRALPGALPIGDTI